MKYKYTKKCREISGFGGDYEKKCKEMVLAGVDYIEKNNIDINSIIITECKNVIGIINPKNKIAKKLIKYMVKSIHTEPTGAMVQASVHHVMYACKHGWKKYIEEMEKSE